jgi:hypothetical protein
MGHLSRTSWYGWSQSDGSWPSSLGDCLTATTSWAASRRSSMKAHPRDIRRKSRAGPGTPACTRAGACPQGRLANAPGRALPPARALAPARKVGSLMPLAGTDAVRGRSQQTRAAAQLRNHHKRRKRRNHPQSRRSRKHRKHHRSRKSCAASPPSPQPAGVSPFARRSAARRVDDA